MSQQAPEGSRLFVGNLAWETTDQTLGDAFTQAGVEPVEAKVITDRYTGRSRGFGFVTFRSVDDASMAREKLHNQLIDNRPVRVDVATSQGGGGGRQS